MRRRDFFKGLAALALAPMAALARTEGDAGALRKVVGQKKADLMEEMRAVAHKGPLVCTAWGYDMEGKPNRNNDVFVDGDYNNMVQKYTPNPDLGREELFELGRKCPYHRYVSFPVEVASEITVMPEPQEVQVYEDDNKDKSRRIGPHICIKYGGAVLDSRRVLLGEF